MSDKNPNTDDIFAKIRGGAAKPAPEAESPAAEPAATTPDPIPAKPAATGSPADIMASIRGGGGGAAKPAAAQPAAAKPAAGGSPMDMIRSGGAGGAKKPAAPAAGGSIMDSIRGGGGGAAKPAIKAAPAAARTIDPSKAAGLTAAEMIQAARQGVGSDDSASGKPKATPGKVVLPSKPLARPPVASAAAGKKAAPNRRDMLAFCLGIVCSPVIWGWTSLLAATTASGLAMARFMMPNVLVEPPTKFKIGPPSDYGFGTVSTKWKAQFGVWIVNSEVDGIRSVYALSTVCTHLGCTPNWLEGEQKFKCPCHGSGFYKSGVNFEGPAPRPLERHGIRLAEDGMLEVDKSVKFQKELGQWEIAACYVTV